ncbi:MAG: outer membrane beta-barrel protein, partial [Desulfarculaceae bacterium]|nr:outer membrane beta-barrel protein [Desulfarculaceae bacterium]
RLQPGGAVLLHLTLCLLASLALALCLPATARPAIISPYVTLTGGWSDNVRLTRVPRSDFFLKAGLGINGQWKWPGHELLVRAGAQYAKYLDLTDLDGFDSANLGFNYQYTPSPRWQFMVSDTYTSTFDKPELSDTGELVTVRDTTGRVDRNTFSLKAKHKYSSTGSVEVMYTNTFTRGENEDQEDTDFNQAAINWNHHLTYQWELGMGVSGTRTNYQISPDEERGRAYARLTRLMGPSMRTYGQLSYAINRATDEDDQLTDDSRNYETLSFEAGISQDVSRRLSWSFGAGWSMVNGNDQYNNAADKGFPLLNASVTYRGPRWNLTGYATADLGQFDYLGDNSGLAVSHRAGVTYGYRFTKFQNLNLTAEYVRNDYQESPIENLNSQQGIVNSYRFLARYTWQVHRHWRLSLEYSYLNRDAEVDDDDRQQNQVLLILYTDYPFRW